MSKKESMINEEESAISDREAQMELKVFKDAEGNINAEGASRSCAHIPPVATRPFDVQGSGESLYGATPVWSEQLQLNIDYADKAAQRV